MVTESCLSSFFWYSNVTVIVPERVSSEQLCAMRWPLRWKRISRRHKVLVHCFSSGMFVCRYSQERMAKNMAPVHNCAMAMFSSVILFLWSWRITISGSAFCCRSFSPLFLQPIHCWDRMWQRRPPESTRGSDRLWSLMICATSWTVERAVPSAKEDTVIADDVPSRTAYAKAQRRRVRWCGSSKLSRKRSPSTPMLCRNLRTYGTPFILSKKSTKNNPPPCRDT